MKERLDLLGALAAHVILVTSILVFSARLALKVPPGHWIGIPNLLMAFPLIFLLAVSPKYERPILYYLQISIMLIWIVTLLLADYIFKFDFRETQWMVISYVMLYFAGLGGMIGVSALAGRGWAISAIILFVVSAVLAFAQRAVTGY